MLKKIVSIKNLGRFRNAPAEGDSHFAKHTLIVGANGYGKTTLCAMLRSLQSGSPDHLLGRRTLGVEDNISVDLLLESGTTRFDGSTWRTVVPALAVFDGTFIAENVHSGDVVDLEHKRSLYRVIIGQEGVRLAEEDTRLSKESREKTTEITAEERALKVHVPAGMTLGTFLGLPNESEIDTRITEQRSILTAARESATIVGRAPLSTFTLPELPEEFETLLTQTVDDLASDAEQQVEAHLAAHGMAPGGAAWLADGVKYIGEQSCPFCGQRTEALSLLAAYRALFSDGYTSLKTAIATMRTSIVDRFGEGAIGALNTTAEQNNSAVEFWSRYVAFDSASVELPPATADAIRGLGNAALALLDAKARAPLDRIEPGTLFSDASVAYAETRRKAAAANEAVQSVNTLIGSKKDVARAANVNAAQGELNRLEAVKKRHGDDIAQACSRYSELVGQKATIEAAKERARTALERHTAQVVRPYEQRINKYLEAFNAGFSIADTAHTYPGGVAASSYQLVINQHLVDIGDGRTPSGRPSFKNTLSAGDRSTLALAFFLAHLDQDGRLADKIVVFDDPFTSQDAFRRRQTVQEIIKVGRLCKQIIVFSHDATFLKQLWEKCAPGERAALQIWDARTLGSRIRPIDLLNACQGRTATDLDHLQTYLTTGAGRSLDIIRKIRVVLEAFCQTTYPGHFDGARWLGEMVGKIREGGEAHPAWGMYDDLDQLNDYTSQYHHGEDVADATPDQIDETELTGYVRRTLRLVNALQA